MILEDCKPVDLEEIERSENDLLPFSSCHFGIDRAKPFYCPFPLMANTKFCQNFDNCSLQCQSDDIPF